MVDSCSSNLCIGISIYLMMLTWMYWFHRQTYKWLVLTNQRRFNSRCLMKHQRTALGIRVIGFMHLILAPTCVRTHRNFISCLVFNKITKLLLCSQKVNKQYGPKFGKHKRCELIGLTRMLSTCFNHFKITSQHDRHIVCVHQDSATNNKQTKIIDAIANQLAFIG